MLDHRQRILAEALQRDAGDDLALPVHLGDAAALVRRQLDTGHVLEQHRHAAVALDHDLLKVGEVLDVAAPAHGELGLGDLDRAAADIHVAVADHVADFGERNAERLQAPRVDHDAILLDEAPDAGDLGHALGLGKPKADGPVLNRAKLGEALLRPANNVLIDPANAGRVGTDAGRDARGQPSRGGTEIFEHARARPIEVGAVLEDHIDEGDAEKGEAAHHPRLRHGQHGGGQRIGDLVLDHLRGLSRILRIDDDLHVGEVGDRIQRYARDGVHTGQSHEDRREPHQEDVAGRPADEPRDHGCGSCWLKVCSAARRLLSASMRKVAEVTTSSPGFRPSLTST